MTWLLKRIKSFDYLVMLLFKSSTEEENEKASFTLK